LTNGEKVPHDKAGTYENAFSMKRFCSKNINVDKKDTKAKSSTSDFNQNVLLQGLQKRRRRLNSSFSFQ